MIKYRSERLAQRAGDFPCLSSLTNGHVCKSDSLGRITLLVPEVGPGSAPAGETGLPASEQAAEQEAGWGGWLYACVFLCVCVCVFGLGGGLWPAVGGGGKQGFSVLLTPLLIAPRFRQTPTNWTGSKMRTSSITNQFPMNNLFVNT